MGIGVWRSLRSRFSGKEAPIPAITTALWRFRGSKAAGKFWGPSRRRDFSISVVLISFNHVDFLVRRFESILRQTVEVKEIIVFDDGSNDGSWAVIQDYAEQYPNLVRAFKASTNGGSVFASWESAYRRATGDLIWLVESDDSAPPDFLERIVPHFWDESVSLAFGRIEYMDENDSLKPGLQAYRRSVIDDAWNRVRKMPAHWWFTGPFAKRNLIPNVGGCVFRHQVVTREEWDIAQGFRIFGDWFLYSRLARGGQVVYEPKAVSYFRLHGGNISANSAQRTKGYFEEYYQFLRQLQRDWVIPSTVVASGIDHARRLHTDVGSMFDFHEIPWVDLLSCPASSQKHILLGLLSISIGGGEILPIHLANELTNRGIKVSVVIAMDDYFSDEVRALLDARVSIYSADCVRASGPHAFVRDVGVTHLHSHFAEIEAIFVENGPLDVPYLVTLHGSYEAMDIPHERLSRWVRNIDGFAAVAQKNLKPLESIAKPSHQLVRTTFNAVPAFRHSNLLDPTDLGFPKDTFLFGLFSRAVDGKGWIESVDAFAYLQREYPEERMGLVLVGDGPMRKLAEETACGVENVRFLGNRLNIQQLMTATSAVLLPSRFRGESFPLVILEAFSVGKSVIASNVGETGRLIRASEQSPAGILIPPMEDDEDFVFALSHAMKEVLCPDNRLRFESNALRRSGDFTLSSLTDFYVAFYSDLEDGRRKS